MPDYKKEKYNFLIPTIKFSIIGFFLSGLPAIILFGVSQFFENWVTQNDCISAIIYTWWTSFLGSIILPVLFFIYLKKFEVYKRQSLQFKLVLFNFMEYVLITGSLCIVSSNPKILCYGHDGQIGLEIVFMAWCAIPFLIIYSFVLNRQSIIAEYS